jgi:hypothetical protein
MADKSILSILVCTLIKIWKFILITYKIKKFYCPKLYAHLRYFLEGDRPSQTNNLRLSILKCIFNIFNLTTTQEVFQKRYKSPS